MPPDRAFEYKREVPSPTRTRYGIPPWAWIGLLATGLLFFRLGAHGFWDPLEIERADLARAVTEGGVLADLVRDGKISGTSALATWVSGASFAAFGPSEWAGRAPLALFGLLCILLIYRLGQRLFGHRVGVVAALILLTTPAFLFQGRTLISNIPLYLALLASIGGATAYLFPRDGRRSRFDLGIAALGLLVGTLAGGFAVGVLLSLLTIGSVLAVNWRTKRHRDGASNGRPLVVLALTLLVVAAAIGAAMALRLPTTDLPYAFWGAIPKARLAPVEISIFEQVLRDLGFSMFPWMAFLPLALLRLARGGLQTTAASQTGAEVAILLTCLFGYAASALYRHAGMDLSFPALPWVALACAVFLVDAADRSARQPLSALFSAGLILILTQDVVVRPEDLVFSHLAVPPAFPEGISVHQTLRFFGIAFAILAFAGLYRPQIRWGTFRLALRIQGAGYAFFVLALVFAGYCSASLLPALSRHLSPKGLFQTYQQCKQPGDLLGQYDLSGRASAYYVDAPMTAISGPKALFGFLNRPERVFVLMPATRLGAVDQHARRHQETYYVVNNDSSTAVLLSNRLAGACAEDKNPLRQWVFRSRPEPARELSVNFDKRVALIGVDLPTEIARGETLVVTLYFEVLGKMPRGYKIFLHVDRPAHRFNGDHEPLGGKLGTQYWLPGDFLVDRHEIRVPRLTTPAGVYQVYTGFWRGQNRLRIVDGPQDGSDRVPLGTLRVR